MEHKLCKEKEFRVGNIVSMAQHVQKNFFSKFVRKTYVCLQEYGSMSNKRLNHCAT